VMTTVLTLSIFPVVSAALMTLSNSIRVSLSYAARRSLYQSPHITLAQTVPTVSLLPRWLCLHAFTTVMWPSLSLFEP
jgi:hypothetical protein